MNFKEFEELINSGVKEIALNEDLILGEGEEEKYSYAIEINANDLIIDGNNHIINGKDKVPMLNILASNVVLRNITFKNGFSGDIGGAITNRSNDLRIEHCQFIDNATDNCSSFYGGAIYNAPGSRLLIEKSVFKDNGSDYGGAIYIDSNSTLKLNNSVFESNTCEFDGGAIYNKGELTINKSIFNNNASFYGGAIFNESALSINDSHFRFNIASEGNDIKTENGNVTVSGSVCEFIDGL